MRVSGRLFAWNLTLLPLAAVFAAGAGAVGRFSRQTFAQLPALLSEATSAAMGREVRIGRAEWDGKRLVLTDLTIAEGRTLAEKPPIAVARQAAAVVDWRRILSPRDAAEPFVDHIEVTDPQVLLRRNDKGEWNVAALFRKPRPEGARNLAHEIRVRNGRLHYVDARFVLPWRTKITALNATLAALDGSLYLEPGDRYRWSASGASPNGKLRQATVQGSYAAKSADLVLTATGLRASIADWNGFLPEGAVVRSGEVAGAFLLAHRFGGPTPPRYTAKLRIRNASLKLPRTREDLRQVEARANLTSDRLSGQAAFTLSGVRCAASGNVVFGKTLRFDADFETQETAIPLLARLLPDRLRKELSPRLPGTARVWGQVAGTQRFPRVSLSIRGRLAPTSFRGLLLPRGALAEAVVHGEISRPRVTFSVQALSAETVGFSATQLNVRGRIDGKSVTGSFVAKAGSGSVAADVRLPDYERDAFEGRATVRKARLEALPRRFRESAGLGGQISADVAFSRRPGGKLRTRWIAAVSDVVAHGVSFAEAHLHLITEGTLVRIARAEMADEAGTVRASGRADAESGRLGLEFEADGLNLGALASRFQNPDTPDWSGLVFIRGGQIEGSWDRPRYRAQVEILMPGAGNYRADYASASLAGDRHALWLGPAEVLRLPGRASVRGAIRRPFGPKAVAFLSAEFVDLELAGLLRTAGIEMPAAGRAEGEAEIAGLFDDLRIEVAPLHFAGLEAGGVPLANASAKLVLRPSRDRWLVAEEASATVEGADVRLSGNLSKDGSFEASAVASGISLDLLNPYLSGWATLGGRAGAEASARGQWKNGKWQTGSGNVRLAARDVRVNEHSVGTLEARGQFEPGRFMAVAGPMELTPARLDGPAGSLSLKRLEYDDDTGTIRIDGGLSRASAQTLLALLQGSPALISRPDAARVLAILADPEAPFSGEISGTFALLGDVRRTMDRLQVRWNDIAADVPETRLRLGDAALRIGGAYRNTGVLEANARLEAFPLSRLRRWLPDVKGLDRLSGTLASAEFAISGSAESPLVRGAARLEQVAYTLATSLDGAPRALRIPSLDVGAFQVGTGRLSAESIGAEFLASDPGQPEKRLRVTVSAETAFDWNHPGLSDEAIARVHAVVPKQDLSLLVGLFPGAGVDAEGSISADLTLSGTVGEIRNPGTSRLNPTLSLDGKLLIAAGRIRPGGSRTVLTDVNLPLRFAKDRVRLENAETTGPVAVAVARVTDPRSGKIAATSEPLFVSGELPLRAGASGASMRLQAKRVVFAESPLPFYRSGRAAGELSSGISGEDGLDLTISGSVFRPEIAGNVRIRKTDVRLPDEAGVFARRSASGWFLPAFRIAVHAGEQVRIAAGQLSASVRTAEFFPIVIQGTLAEPRLAGTLSVDSGSLQFPSTRFQVVPGGLVSLRFPSYDSLGVSDPGLAVLVRLSAKARVSARSVNRETKVYTVTVNARGPLNTDRPLTVGGEGTRPSAAGADGLQLTFQADPPDLALTSQGLQNRIAGILGGEDAIQGLFGRSSGRSGTLAERLSGILSNRFVPDLLERTGVAQALGLELLNLEYDPAQSFTLRISRQLSGPFEMSFLHRFGSSPLAGVAEYAQWELRTSARLRRDLRLSWTMDEQKTNAYLLEGVFRF